jgi:predicted PurR-regulated permease PerM
MGFLMNMGFVSFTMFYLFLDGDKAVRVLREWLPLDPKDSHALVHRCGEIISASVYGVVVLAAIQGTLGGLMFWWLGLPSPLLWGLVMILMATIPMLGTFVVWVPAAIYLAVTGHLIKAAILTFWGAVVIGMADNLLRPRLVGEKTKMHDLLIFFAVLGGLQAFGVLGILMGPVVLAVAITLLETFRRGDRYQRPAPVEATDPSKDLY